jgi:hypothetical protein
MGVLGIIAAVAVLIGGVQSTMAVSADDRQAVEGSQTPVVEVQTIRTMTNGTSEY